MIKYMSDLPINAVVYMFGSSLHAPSVSLFLPVLGVSTDFLSSLSLRMTMEYAAKPPPGVTPDYDNPARNGVCRLFVVIPLLMALATIMVALRLYTRKFIVKNVGMDDCRSRIQSP